MSFNQLSISTRNTFLWLRNGKISGSMAPITTWLPTINNNNHWSPNRQLLNQKTSIVQYYQKRTVMKLWRERTLREMYWRSKRFDVEPKKIRARSEWQDWNYSSEIYAFAQRLGEGNLSEEALTRAFTHQSYVKKQQLNQEQLGIAGVDINLNDNSELIDSGREIIIKHVQCYLRYHLQKAPEECIQAITEYLLSDPILADISKWIGCTDLIFCEELPPSESTLANTVPAIVATISQQYDLKRANNFITDFILTYLNGTDLLEIWKLEDINLDLNRYLELKGEPPCEARILYRSAIGTIEACYVVGIYQGSEHRLIGQGPGESLKIARHMAELDAFRNIFELQIENIRFQFGPKAYELNLQQFEQENFHIFQQEDKQKSVIN